MSRIFRSTGISQPAEALRRLGLAKNGHEAPATESAPQPDYHLVTNWRVEGSVEEVADILSDALDLPRWWPSVYLEVEELQPGDERGIGQVLQLVSKGWLPYKLNWVATVTDLRLPEMSRIEVRGNFVGVGEWTFRQDGPHVDVTYDWQIRLTGVFGRLSFLLKPVFTANHYWAMGKGEESLKLELARRHARAPEEAALVPAPPGPASLRQLLLPLAALGAAAVGLVYSLRRLSRGART